VNVTLLRTALTLLVTGLSSVAAAYPHLAWIPAILAGVSVVGIHAVPSIGDPRTSSPDQSGGAP
jgi:hypothetical protein